jgi:prevent-host-death family protein
MKTVGVRELRNRLSEYLRDVRAGETILVTDRGEVIAEISVPRRPALDPHVPPGLEAMAQRGWLTLPTAQQKYKIFPPQRPCRKGPSSRELLDEIRGGG